MKNKLGIEQRKVKVVIFFSKFCFVCMPETKYVFDPERKGSLFFMLQTTFGQFASDLPPQQSENTINGFKLLFAANLESVG